MNAPDKTIIKWVFYSSTVLLSLLLQNLLLTHIEFQGIHPFILPCAALIPASMEDRRQSLIFSFVVGIICDLTFPGVFPCFYTLVLYSAAWVSSLISKRVIMPGLICSFAVSAIGLFFMDLLHCIYFTQIYGASFSTVFTLLLKELLMSLLFVPMIHLADSKIYLRFSKG